MRALVTSVFHDGTGYAEAAGLLARALEAAGYDVACRPVKLSAGVHLQPAVGGMLHRDLAPYDLSVSCVLPSDLAYERAAGRNVCAFAWEADRLPGGWAERLNLMDEVWAVSRQQAEACVDGGVSVPVRVVPHACDVERYLPRRRGFDLPVPDGTFCFYTVSEAVPRKNLADLVRCFAAEFHEDEPVCLVIKASLPGSGEQQCREHMEAVVRSATGGVPSPDVLLVTARLPDEELLGLHDRCDCFVTASHSEAWALPAFDAMAMGKTPIVPASTGFLDWAEPTSCDLVPVRAVCAPADGSLPGLLSGRELWWAPDHAELRRAMRKAYTRSPERRADMARRGRARANKYSVEAVGGLLKGLLAGQHGQGAVVPVDGFA